jgi:hypothetical protein
MTLADARDAYEALSGKASDIMRQLGLGGLALIWLFHKDSAKGPVLDDGLLHAALFIFIAIIFDFLQYVVGATIWFRHFRRKEKEGLKDDTPFKAPPHLNWPTWALFYLKSAMVLIAYACYIIPFLVQKFGA